MSLSPSIISAIRKRSALRVPGIRTARPQPNVLRMAGIHTRIGYLGPRRRAEQAPARRGTIGALGSSMAGADPTRFILDPVDMAFCCRAPASFQRGGGGEAGGAREAACGDRTPQTAAGAGAGASAGAGRARWSKCPGEAVRPSAQGAGAGRCKSMSASGERMVLGLRRVRIPMSTPRPPPPAPRPPPAPAPRLDAWSNDVEPCGDAYMLAGRMGTPPGAYPAGGHLRVDGSEVGLLVQPTRDLSPEGGEVPPSRCFRVWGRWGDDLRSAARTAGVGSAPCCCCSSSSGGMQLIEVDAGGGATGKHHRGRRRRGFQLQSSDAVAETLVVLGRRTRVARWPTTAANAAVATVFCCGYLNVVRGLTAVVDGVHRCQMLPSFLVRAPPPQGGRRVQPKHTRSHLRTAGNLEVGTSSATIAESRAVFGQWIADEAVCAAHEQVHGGARTPSHQPA